MPPAWLVGTHHAPAFHTHRVLRIDAARAVGRKPVTDLDRFDTLDAHHGTREARVESSIPFDVTADAGEEPGRQSLRPTRRASCLPLPRWISAIMRLLARASAQ